MNGEKPLYEIHERIWHWLQAAALIALLLTGFAIHYPDRFPILGDMARSVRWHSWIGLFMIANAFLGLFYHVTAEKYAHYLPSMNDFTTGAIKQLHYYLVGIFKGDKHPLETDPRRKLNSLQKLTYLALLNVLVPFQLATGALLLGADRWPRTFERFGGLKVLAPAHTLGAFLFLAFLFLHIYLTTTGHTPTSLLRAMITGYEVGSSGHGGTGEQVVAEQDDATPGPVSGEQEAVAAPAS